MSPLDLSSNHAESTDAVRRGESTVRSAVLRDALEEPWFSEPTPSSARRSSVPPAVAVGEFLGDPLADAWLR